MNTENAFMEMRGDREILIDGCSMLLEYNEEAVVLLLGKQKLKICGEKLCMDLLNESRMAVSGKIDSVEFLR